MGRKNHIDVQGSTISILTEQEYDLISLTDMTKSFSEGSGLIGKWITNKNTIEYMGIWESIHNSYFNYPEFRVIEHESGTNRFILSVGQWINRTKSIGLQVKSGRYGGTYAHKDIAFHFAMWLSPKFQIYLVKEFQRLKEDEHKSEKLVWSYQRHLTKVNYHIHTDAIREYLIPKELTKTQITIVYANEADLLNVALFGFTAKQWRDENSDLDGNIRDFATIEQLVILSNLESINAMLIQQGVKQSDRLIQLNRIAISQMKSLIAHSRRKQLE